MSKAKAILINGFAGAGKTTIASMYVDNHPLSMVIESDELIVNVGGWFEREVQARSLVFELTKKMLETSLSLGHDVVLPYLTEDAARAAEFEEVVKKSGAEFYEFYLATDKDHAIERLFKRGTWGEAGVPPITESDLPTILELYDKMEKALPKRPNQRHIQIKEGDPARAYEELLRYTENTAG